MPYLNARLDFDVRNLRLMYEMCHINLQKPYFDHRKIDFDIRELYVNVRNLKCVFESYTVVSEK